MDLFGFFFLPLLNIWGCFLFGKLPLGPPPFQDTKDTILPPRQLCESQGVWGYDLGWISLVLLPGALDLQGMRQRPAENYFSVEVAM